MNQFHNISDANNLWEVFWMSTSSIAISLMTFVAIGVVLAELINYYFKDKITDTLKKHKKYQPLLGGLLGLIPGCGGTIFLVPLYTRKQASFGALTASFIATMGEAAFLLLAKNPLMYVYISLASLIAGIITGYVLDFTKLSNFFESKISFDKKHNEEHKHGDKKVLTFIDTKAMPIYLFIMLLLTFPMTIIEVFIPHHIWENHAGVHFYMYDFGNWWGMLFVLSIVIYYITRTIYVKVMKYETRVHTHEKHTSLWHVIHDAFLNIIFISSIAWIGVLALDMSFWGVGEEGFGKFFKTLGLLNSFIIVLLIGIIPGCAPQIMLMTLYMGIQDGNTTHTYIATSAMLANAMVQDGDAGFPLLVSSKSSFLWVKITNLIPAIIVGSILLGLEYGGILPLPTY